MPQGPIQSSTVLYQAAYPIVAHAGGGKANATPIPNSGPGRTVVVTKAATAADSVALPPAISPGALYTVIVEPTVAAAPSVWPNGTDTIGGASAAYSCAVGSVTRFYSVGPGAWVVA